MMGVNSLSLELVSVAPTVRGDRRYLCDNIDVVCHTP